MIDKALIKDCLDWFRACPGLEPPPDVDSIRVIGPEPGGAIPLDEPEAIPISRDRWIRALVHGAALCAALVLLLHLAVGWNSPLAFVLLTVVFTLCYGFPVALAVSSERLAVEESEADSSEGPAALARTVALALYNSNRARQFLHACLDILLFPLMLSCQAAVAEWAARGYCLDHELPYRPHRLRARVSVLPLRLAVRLLGPRAAGFAIRWL